MLTSPARLSRPCRLGGPHTPRQLPAFRYRKEKSSERGTVFWREPDSNHRSGEKETAVERGPAADHRRLARRPALNDPIPLSVYQSGISRRQQPRDLSPERDRWFESGSLQRGVRCELDLGEAASTRVTVRPSERARSNKTSGRAIHPLTHQALRAWSPLSRGAGEGLKSRSRKAPLPHRGRECRPPDRSPGGSG